MSGRILKAFDESELRVVHDRLLFLCALLRHVPGGEKIEEGYWATLYRAAKGIPGKATWSNKPFKDFLYGGLGVEWKLLQRKSPSGDQGRSLMHPAATRTIFYDPSQPAEICKDVILTQWRASIRDFRERVRETSAAKTASEIRWGVLLWSLKLDEFLYFEEEIVDPDPADFRAEWVDGMHRGKPKRNLQILENTTNKVRYSVTLPRNGVKLQPYFDVPTVEQGAHLFRLPVATTQPLLVEKSTCEALLRAAVAAGKDPSSFIADLLARPASPPAG